MEKEPSLQHPFNPFWTISSPFRRPQRAPQFGLQIPRSAWSHCQGWCHRRSSQVNPLNNTYCSDFAWEHQQKWALFSSKTCFLSFSVMFLHVKNKSAKRMQKQRKTCTAKKHDGQLPCYFPSKTSPCNAGCATGSSPYQKHPLHQPAHLQVKNGLHWFALELDGQIMQNAFKHNSWTVELATLGTPWSPRQWQPIDGKTHFSCQIRHCSCFYLDSLFVPTQKQVFYHVLLKISQCLPFCGDVWRV